MEEARCPSLSLVLPAYNEAEGIAAAVAEVEDRKSTRLNSSH